MLSYCKQFPPLKFGPRVSDYVSLSKQRAVAMLLLALLSASPSPMFPLVAFPCYFLPALIPLTQLCECCLPQEKLQSPDQQSKTGGFWELHMCGGEPAGKGQLYWHRQRPKQWVYWLLSNKWHRCTLLMLFWLLSCQMRWKGGHRKQACNNGNMHGEQLSTHVAH